LSNEPTKPTALDIRLAAHHAMAHLGYAPPHPDSARYESDLKRFDARWAQQLANAERFLNRVHDLECQREEPA